MIRHIAHANASRKQSENNQVEPPSEEDKAIYEAWKDGREKNSFCDFSSHQQMEIREAIRQYEEKYGPIDEVHLSGSYASGSWIDWDTPAEEIEIRKLVKRFDHLSDIDLIPFPFTESITIGSVDFSKVPKGRKVKIYQNGEFL
ncbi:MAG: hypothetical protein ACWA44_02420 [Thiotrichales bacterium]